MNEVQTVDFHGSPITVIEHNGAQYVAMKPIVEAMGLNWTRQFRKITSDPVLNSVVAEMAITAQDGKNYQTICLPLDFLNGWLFKIDANRYKNDFDRFNAIVTYQQKCYRVLFDYFHNGGAINPRADDTQIAALIAALREEAYRRVAAEEENKRLRAHNKKLATAAAPTCEYGEASEYNGLPRDILVSRYLRSDPRPHAPSLSELLQLLLPLYATAK